MLKMQLTNNECVGRALECLRKGLLPYVVESLQRTYNGGWQREARESLPAWREADKHLNLDAQALITLLLDKRHAELSSSVPPRTRTLVFELRDVRRRHAHQEIFDSREVDRALDTTELLLKAIGSSEAAIVAKMRVERATSICREPVFAELDESDRNPTPPLHEQDPSNVSGSGTGKRLGTRRSGVVQLSRDFIKHTIHDFWNEQRHWVTRDQLAELLNQQEWISERLDAEGISDSIERQKRVGNWVDWFSANYTSGLHELKDEFEQAKVDGKWAYRPRQKA
jgi:hypothetical protein